MSGRKGIGFAATEAVFRGEAKGLRGFDDDDLVRWGEAHALLPQVCLGLIRAESFAADPARQPVRERYLQHCAANFHLVRALGDIASAFDSAGIPHLSFKGPVLAQMLHGDVTQRQFADLDILVRPEELGPAEECLRQLGYKARDTPRPEGNGFFRPKYHVRFVRPSDGVYVEIHWALIDPATRTHIPDTLLFAQAISVSIGDFEFPTFPLEIHLVSLAVHGAKHRWERLGWLRDIAALAEKPGLDWDRAWEIAGRLHARRRLEIALRLAARLAGRTPPDRTIRPTGGGALRVVNHLECLLLRDTIPRYRHYDELKIDFLSRDSAADAWPFLRDFLRARVKPNERDRKVVRLPWGFGVLYYPIRVYRLVRERVFGIGPD